MVESKHIKYKFSLINGPKDGEEDYMEKLPPTLEYITAPNRLAIYDQVKDGVYKFSQYMVINDGS